MTATTGFERDNVGLFIRKDPQSVMDYIVDYTNFLGTGDAFNGLDLSNWLNLNQLTSGLLMTDMFDVHLQTVPVKTPLKIQHFK